AVSLTDDYEDQRASNSMIIQPKPRKPWKVIAGVGAAATAAGSASVSHPVKSGLVQVLSVFIDTIVVCTATAFLLLCSGVEPTAEAAGMSFVQAAVGNVFGQFGVVFITIALILFAFTTVIGNYFYAETGMVYILDKLPSKAVRYTQRAIAIVVVFVGSFLSLGVAWDTADVLMGLMAIINVPVLAILAKPALLALSDYIRQKKEGKNPVFKAADISLKDKTDFWN
ncbi:MAG: alanine:cation symporter family protein, partial [Oscillospiraceae bacterium]|nr:alanine:cation symporter family protein [Oscillospiraceae bacterium]